MPDIPGLDQVDFLGSTTAVMGQVGYWLGILFASGAILAVMVAGYYYLTFRYSMTIFPLYGSGKDGVFSFGRPRGNRFKWNKRKTAWKQMLPLMNKKEIEPFDQEYIYPGNKLYAFEINNQLIPGRVNIELKPKDPNVSLREKEAIEDEINKLLKIRYGETSFIPCAVEIPQSEDEIRAKINPVPHHVREWQSLQHKKNALEFAETDWWSENKTLFTALAVTLFCCILCGFTIWYTYKFAVGGLVEGKEIAQIISSIGRIPGAPGS